MPKTKKATLKAKKPLTSKKTASKRLKRPVFKFNIQEVLNNRQLEAKLLEQTPKLKDDFQITDELCQEQLDKIFDLEDDDKLPLESFDPMFFINYNIPFNDNSGSDFKKLCLQRLQIMSVEGNELRGKIQSNILMRANWSPLFDVCFKIINSIHIACVINNCNYTLFNLRNLVICRLVCREHANTTLKVHR